MINRILLVCLLHALSEIVSSVGKNFAQPIKVVDGKGNIKKFAIKRCMRDRKLSIKDAFKGILNEINADRKLFSKNNSVYQLDALKFLDEVDMSQVT